MAVLTSPEQQSLVSTSSQALPLPSPPQPDQHPVARRQRWLKEWLCVLLGILLVALAATAIDRVVETGTAVGVVALEVGEGDDGPDRFWSVSTLACLGHTYEASQDAQPLHTDCQPYLGLEPNNITCAGPDSYMTSRCAREERCMDLCGHAVAEHKVAPCLFAAFSDLHSTCRTLSRRRALRRRQSQEQRRRTAVDEENEVWCDRVAVCNLCNDECLSLVNPALRMHHLFTTATQGWDADDDGKAAWTLLPLVRHLDEICACSYDAADDDERPLEQS